MPLMTFALYSQGAPDYMSVAYGCKVASKEILSLLAKTKRRNNMKHYKYIVVGGGMTADAAVTGIREIDETGTIAILSSESDPPYARPPLSKDLWTKDKSIDDIWLKTEQKGAEIISSREVVSLTPKDNEVADDNGNTYRYDQLLLATGGSPITLPMGEDQIIYFRTCGDYKRLRHLAVNAAHFAVFGGGFIGAELAAALSICGKQVTMVFPEAAVGGLMLPKQFAETLNSYYRYKGITIVSGCKPSGVNTKEGSIVVTLESCHKFTVDGIVAGIGIEPNTQLAESAGLTIDDGIIVDEQLRTDDHNIFAAGDVANFYNPIMEQRMRVEHEDNALTMGKTAGRNMAGEKDPYHHLPYFYSDLFDLGYEAVGQTSPLMETITSLQHPEDKGCIFYMTDNRVRGVVFWNMFENTNAGRELIAAPGPHSKDDLKAWEKERLNS